MTSHLTWFAVVSWLMAVACGPRVLDPEDILWEDRVDVDEGFLCLSTEETPTIKTLGVQPQVFEAGAPLKVHYDAARCFGGCERNMEVALTSALGPDNVLSVETTLRWEEAPPQRGLLCASFCTQLDQVFEVAPLPDEGTYTLAWAGQELEFTVPGEAFVCLATREP